jgi:hypothetical protein
MSCGYAIGFARSVGATLDPVLADYLAQLTARPAYKRAAETGATRISGQVMTKLGECPRRRRHSIRSAARTKRY